MLKPFAVVWFSAFAHVSYFEFTSLFDACLEKNRYWLDAEQFFNHKNSTLPPEKTRRDTESHTHLPRFGILPKSKLFCNKHNFLNNSIPCPLYNF